MLAGGGKDAQDGSVRIHTDSEAGVREEYTANPKRDRSLAKHDQKGASRRALRLFPEGVQAVSSAWAPAGSFARLVGGGFYMRTAFPLTTHNMLCQNDLQSKSAFRDDITTILSLNLTHHDAPSVPLLLDFLGADFAGLGLGQRSQLTRSADIWMTKD